MNRRSWQEIGNGQPFRSENFSPLLEREIAGHQGRAAFVGGLKTSNSSSAPDFDSGTNPRSSTISDVAVPKFWFVAVL